jgi:hypothetical protein
MDLFKNQRIFRAVSQNKDYTILIKIWEIEKQRIGEKKHVGPDGPGISFLNFVATDISALRASEKFALIFISQTQRAVTFVALCKEERK